MIRVASSRAVGPLAGVGNVATRRQPRKRGHGAMRSARSSSSYSIGSCAIRLTGDRTPPLPWIVPATRIGWCRLSKEGSPPTRAAMAARSAATRGQVLALRRLGEAPVEVQFRVPALGQAAGSDLEGSRSKMLQKMRAFGRDVAVVEVDEEDAGLTDILRPRRSRTPQRYPDDVDSACSSAARCALAIKQSATSGTATYSERGFLDGVPFSERNGPGRGPSR